ncbi:MAG: hypothetical protein M5U28_50745 [Sandaracinaceae bacterium]|nr:hypothetical protein [Sandaracinaceae bacterium]
MPIAGPWIQIGIKPTTFDQDYWGMWLVIDGLLQAAGATMLIIGIATPQTETVLAGGGLRDRGRAARGPELGGLALLGRF